jgi:hypothetical protein
MRVLNCNHIKDTSYLSELLRMSDLEVFNVKYLDISILFSQQKFLAHFHCIPYLASSFNLC